MKAFWTGYAFMIDVVGWSNARGEAVVAAVALFGIKENNMKNYNEWKEEQANLLHSASIYNIQNLKFRMHFGKTMPWLQEVFLMNIKIKEIL